MRTSQHEAPSRITGLSCQCAEAIVPVMTSFIAGHTGHHLSTQRELLRSWRENFNTLD